MTNKSNKLTQEQLELILYRLDQLLDYMEDAGDDKFMSLCLVYDHLISARELIETQTTDNDRDLLERCFNM